MNDKEQFIEKRMLEIHSSLKSRGLIEAFEKEFNIFDSFDEFMYLYKKHDGYVVLEIDSAFKLFVNVDTGFGIENIMSNRFHPLVIEKAEYMIDSFNEENKHNKNVTLAYLQRKENELLEKLNNTSLAEGDAMNWFKINKDREHIKSAYHVINETREVL